MYPLNIDQLLTLKRTTRPWVRITTPTVGYATKEFALLHFEQCDDSNYMDARCCQLDPALPSPRPIQHCIVLDTSRLYTLLYQDLRLVVEAVIRHVDRTDRPQTLVDHVAVVPLDGVDQVRSPGLGVDTEFQRRVLRVVGDHQPVIVGVVVVVAGFLGRMSMAVGTPAM